MPILLSVYLHLWKGYLILLLSLYKLIPSILKKVLVHQFWHPATGTQDLIWLKLRV